MKFLHSAYYILVTLCLIMASCDTILMDEDTSSKESTETLVKLTITFPANTTRATSNDPSAPDYTDGTVGERYINDAQIYIFQDGVFVEKARGLLVGGNNGDVTRTIQGKLSKTYTTGGAEVVLLTNTEANLMSAANLQTGVSTKADLYAQLIYKHDKLNWIQDECSKWIKNIPMWGTTTINNIKEGLIYSASINLTRAIAKVQVVVNDGQGITNFKINSIKVVNHNTEGYCASTTAKGTPNVPKTTAKASMLFSDLNDTQGSFFINQIYIPEHKNIGSDSKVQLEISATAYGKPQTYILNFKDKNKAECDILRNNIYIFNIVSITPPEPEKPDANVGLTYEVVTWGNIQIDVPEFD